MRSAKILVKQAVHSLVISNYLSQTDLTGIADQKWDRSHCLYSTMPSFWLQLLPKIILYHFCTNNNIECVKM